jgi:hypothetical protein
MDRGLGTMNLVQRELAFSLPCLLTLSLPSDLTPLFP